MRPLSVFSFHALTERIGRGMFISMLLLAPMFLMVQIMGDGASDVVSIVLLLSMGMSVSIPKDNIRRCPACRYPTQITALTRDKSICQTCDYDLSQPITPETTKVEDVKPPDPSLP